MAMLTFHGIGQSFGNFDVFTSASGSVPHGGKVGIVGPNGIGKTTLLRILAGLEEVGSGGVVQYAKGTRLGYLRQEAQDAFLGRENTLHEEMLTVFREVRQLEQVLHELMEKMGEDEESVPLYAQKSAEFETMGGYDYPNRIKQVLTGLGFRLEQFDLPLKILSGGQKTRALLARLLLEKPDFLILDEPTNHLDVQAVEWLESVLRSWEGTILVVSHDRYFLDRVVDTIWELSRSGIEGYRGNYTHYLQQREERWLRREAEYEMVVKRFLEELDYIKRNIARDATKNMAVGRLKRLIREVKVAQSGGLSQIANQVAWSQIEGVGNLDGSKWELSDVESAIKSLPRPRPQGTQLQLRLPAVGRSGNIILRTEGLQVGYPDKRLFSADNIELFRLERAALIGPNGAGKSTFLKTILQELPPLQGEITLGASLKIGYFSQAHDRLDPEKTVLEQLMEQPGLLLGEARSYLGRYLFRGDDVYKPIRLLSGGERGRLALALLSRENANFLLLDEPTNHLDIPSQEALQEVLQQFHGTILMVSHDRYLISALATQIWEIRGERLVVFKGGYEEMKEAQAQSSIKVEPKVVKVESADNRPRVSKNELARRQKALEEIEEAIEAAETHKALCAEQIQIASQATDFKAMQDAHDAYQSAEEALAQLLSQWETCATALEESEF